MRRKQYFMCVTAMALGLLCLFTACSKKQGDKDEYTPTSSLEMTDTEAAALGEKVRVILYFTDTKGTNLFAESQLTEFTTKDRRTENMAKKICEMLVAGPANQDTYVNTLPADTAVRSVKMNNGVATVDFNEAFLSNLSTDPAKLDLMMCAIANTLTELKEINQVTVTADGKAPGKMECGFEFKATSRNMDIVSAQAAAVQTDYSEEAFADVPLE